MVVVFVLCVLLILPNTFHSTYYYEVGSQWQHDNLYAAFDFQIEKPDELLQKQKDSLLKDIYEIYYEQPYLQKENANELIKTFKLLSDLVNEWKSKPTSDEWTELCNQNPQTEPWASLITKSNFKDYLHEPFDPVLLQNIQKIYQHIYEKPFVNKSVSSISTPYIAIRTKPSHEALISTQEVLDKEKVLTLIDVHTDSWNPIHKKIATILLSQYAQPNYFFDAAAFENEKELALKTLSKYFSQIHKGQLIVQRGQTISQDLKILLDSYFFYQNQNKASQYKILAWLGEFILLVLLTLILLYYLRGSQKVLFYRNQHLLFLFVVYFLMVSFFVLILTISKELLVNYPVQYYHLAPTCMAALIVTVFFDEQVGFITNVCLSLIGSMIVPNSFEFFIIQFTAGTFAVYTLSMLRSRSQFFITNAILFIAYCVTYIGYELVLTGSLLAINFNNFILFAINIAFSLMTYPLIYLFERFFGMSSDFTYIELLDTKHPLLLELSIQAPGTFQHSLQVANLSESAANKIGANGLQCRAAALFHDIGKIFNPEYFIENQNNRNAHQFLAPHESAKIIIGHVIKGVELAEKYNLPVEIIDFIKTHHGTSRVEFFYRKFLSDHPSLNNDLTEVDFRYPGPLPISKEQAVVMLADSCEAAARSLDEHTPEIIEKLVEKIIDHKIQDGQLAHSHITFRDINKIKTDLQKNLINIYHKRIKYPENPL